MQKRPIFGRFVACEVNFVLLKKACGFQWACYSFSFKKEGMRFSQNKSRLFDQAAF
jgi:hypothetical protein